MFPQPFNRSSIGTAVGPGVIRTRLSAPILEDPFFHAKYTSENGVIPLGRLGTTEDVAAAALFLASDASYISGSCSL